MNLAYLQKPNVTKKGFALTEVLLAIAVIVIIGIAAYPLYKNARTSSEVEVTANDLAILDTNLHVLYAGHNYDTVTNKLIEDSGMAPEDLKTGISGTWVNAWGGVVQVQPQTYGLGNNYMYTVVLTQVPPDACQKLVTRVAPNFTLIGATAIYSIKRPPDAAVNVAKVVSDCNAGHGDITFSNH